MYTKEKIIFLLANYKFFIYHEFGYMVISNNLQLLRETNISTKWNVKTPKIPILPLLDKFTSYWVATTIMEDLVFSFRILVVFVIDANRKFHWVIEGELWALKMTVWKFARGNNRETSADQYHCFWIKCKLSSVKIEVPTFPSFKT